MTNPARTTGIMFTTLYLPHQLFKYSQMLPGLIPGNKLIFVVGSTVRAIPHLLWPQLGQKFLISDSEHPYWFLTDGRAGGREMLKLDQG